jgi:uncharacterized protein (DUF58 family)
MTLAGAQLVLCAITIAVARAGGGWVLVSGGVGLLFGVILLWQFETSTSFRVERLPPEPASDVQLQPLGSMVSA